MFIRFNKSDGIADALYRTPTEIISDIERVRGEISEIRERLNLRVLVLDLISDERVSEQPNLWIDRLEELLIDAKEAEENLGELKCELCELKSELEETQWALGLL